MAEEILDDKVEQVEEEKKKGALGKLKDAILTDPEEQLRRFENDLQQRKKTSRTTVPLDQRFLESLQEGMPPSSGMALGLDRLLLWLTGVKNIQQVLSFSWDEV